MSGQALPYSQRPEWADVVPVRVEEGGKVVAIHYTPDHAEALSYFRAVLRSGELSERVLALTGDMIRYNQADYTAWRTRWVVHEGRGSQAVLRTCRILYVPPSWAISVEYLLLSTPHSHVPRGP